MAVCLLGSVKNTVPCFTYNICIFLYLSIVRVPVKVLTDHFLLFGALEYRCWQEVRGANGKLVFEGVTEGVKYQMHHKFW